MSHQKLYRLVTVSSTKPVRTNNVFNCMSYYEDEKISPEKYRRKV